MEEQDLIHDWNSAGSDAFDWGSVSGIQLDDETLRDGLQNPSVVDPPIEGKIRLLHLMDELGIHTADIGLPGTGPCLPVMFVTEDTARAKPETLKALYGHAIGWGAHRLCLTDTVGHAIPDRVRALVRFVIEEIVEPSGEDVGVDWHGHRDRGLGLANALAAIEAGATRIHGTALGIGERVGNVEMDVLLVNLKLLGLHEADLTRLPEYCSTAAEACQVPLASSYPVVGRDAFRTGTGVHAAAIVKAAAKGDAWVADRIYSGVPASMVGRVQEIEIGPMSGLSNVKAWLAAHGYDPDDEKACRILFEAAKATDHTLTDGEIVGLLNGS